MLSEKKLMKKPTLLMFYVFCVSFFFSVLDLTWAKAPKTAKIVFASDITGNLDIYLMNPDGSEVTQLTQHLSRDYAPVFSPTGEHILFVSHRDGQRDVFLMDADGQNVKRVFRSAADRSAPAWSPDGKGIVYFRYHDEAIYIADIDGKNEKPLAIAGEFGGQPAWSPEGERIVFSFAAANFAQQEREGYPLIFISPEGQNRRKVSLGDLRHKYPSWSPDAEWIAFSDAPWLLDRVDMATIHIMRPDGTQRKRIVSRAGGYARHPLWSPDGTELLYEKKVDEQRHLFRVDITRRSTKQLTHQGVNSLGSWFDPRALPVHPQVHLLTTSWGYLKQP